MELLSSEGGYLISSGIVLVITFIVGVLFKRGYNRLIENSNTRISEDPTKYKFIGHIGLAMIYLIGFGIAIYMIPSLRTLAQSMLAGAGIMAVVIGFAAQNAFSNIVSGVFIIIFKPFRINSRIQVKEFVGVVEDITLRHTILKNFSNQRIVVPNSVISSEFIVNSNLNDSRTTRWIEIGISYDSDIDLAKHIMMEESLNHPLRIDARTDEQIEAGELEVPVRVVQLGDFSVTLRAWVWGKDPSDAFILYCELLESIKKRFDREGIEIPYPYRTIVQKKV
ncbi:mechanosensitive ion channel family protein [Aureitalea marina]|uniref:Mechanosensitive ion channel protein MscS n=1 Tax=Aureitalea marina TaxID=930804 RepID=A0A2S7KPW0_9FLAO|nr:mechanosensitive ion channel family protein [Aureitalea marina]PQB04666.1 mechanosensitive ion channel protein MscS [Aureitalea marina]